MKANQDLNSQQQHLSATSYDLRITNLARFIYRKFQTSNFKFQIVNKQSKKRLTPHVSRYSFLDVGAGNGLFLKFFKDKGFKVAGFELEKKNVENMKKDPMLKSEIIKQADITKISGNQEYDIVMASDVIEHIEDDNLAIKNLWSFVRPGGILVITVPAHSYLFGKRDKMWGHFRRYDKKNFKFQISNLKFSKIEFFTQWNIVGFFIYFLYEKILQKSINENMRYSDSILSRAIRFVLDKILKLEEIIGGLPLGLTLVVGVRKFK